MYVEVVKKNSSDKLLAFCAAMSAILGFWVAFVSFASRSVTESCFSRASRIVFCTVADAHSAACEKLLRVAAAETLHLPTRQMLLKPEQSVLPHRASGKSFAQVEASPNSELLCESTNLALSDQPNREQAAETQPQYTSPQPDMLPERSGRSCISAAAGLE